LNRLLVFLGLSTAISATLAGSFKGLTEWLSLDVLLGLCGM